jgi:antitoxin component YwqK of YwqJK toxin-antitoxin module
MNKWIFFFVLLVNYAFGQKSPDYGLNQVRLTQEESTLHFETIPVNALPAPLQDRLYYWYSAGQIRSTQGGYSGKLLNGTYREFYLNRNLKEQGAYDAGLRTGLWKSWKEDGTLASTYTYDNGVLSGPYVKYNAGGRPAESGNYKNSKLNGIVTYYKGRDSTYAVRYKNGSLTPPRAPLLKRLKQFNPFRKKNNAHRDSTNRP